MKNEKPKIKLREYQEELLKKLDNLEKQNKDLADQNKKMQAQINELKDVQNTTELHNIK